MIENTHSIVKVPSSAIYLLEYFEKLGYNIKIHEDWDHLEYLLTNTADYPYNMDPSFTTDFVNIDNIAFAIYLKKGDEVIGTYAAKEHHPLVVRDGLLDVYPSLETKDLPEILQRNDLTYYYSSCQWVHTEHLGKKLGMALDLLKKHIIFDNRQANINFAIHKINDSMKSYHIDKLYYSNSETFATKKDGNVGGAGGKNDYEYNIVWSIKESFESKLAEIKSIFKI